MSGVTEPHYLALRFLAKDSTNKDLETPSEKEVKEEVNKVQEFIGDTTRKATVFTLSCASPVLPALLSDL